MTKTEREQRIFRLCERIGATTPEIRARFLEFLEKLILDTEEADLKSFVIETYSIVKAMK